MTVKGAASKREVETNTLCRFGNLFCLLCLGGSRTTERLIFKGCGVLGGCS